MKGIRPHLGNFQRCQKLIADFTHQNKLATRDLHKFVGSIDRNTLRMEPNFKPMQGILSKLNEQLVEDPFIASTPLLMAKTCSLYRHLNYFSHHWINHAVSTTSRWIRDTQDLPLHNILPIYQLCVELGWDEKPDELKIIRQKCFGMLLPTFQKGGLPLENRLESLHRDLRSFIQDPAFNPTQLRPMLSNLKILLYQANLNLSNNYSYVHSAMICQLYRVLGIEPGSDRYHQFLEECFNHYLKSRKVNPHSQNTTPQFTIRGESVFEIRFQKHLNEFGYWFERNKVIGLHEYDILLKGRLSQQYYPLAHMADITNLQDRPPITSEQLKNFEKIQNMWVIEEPKQWPEPMLINLNGPYHEIFGDKTGTIRSELDKGRIASHYGYRRFKAINFRDWEQATPNKGSTTRLLRKLTS